MSLDTVRSITQCLNKYGVRATVDGRDSRYCVIHSTTIGAAKLIDIALADIGLFTIHKQRANFTKGVYSIVKVYHG